MTRLNSYLLMFVVVLISGTSLLANDTRDPNAPGPASRAAFADPPTSVRPWVYYWCLKGNISKEQITHDLEEMADKGVGGLLVFDSRRYWDDYASTTHVPVPLEIKHEFMSEGWRTIMKHLVSEAHRLGLQVSFNISDSGGQLRGPWDMKDLGPHELVWTECNLNGPKKVTLDFAIPADKVNYRDVATLAVRITSEVSPDREAVRLNETWGQVTYPDKTSANYDELVDLSSAIQNGKLEWNVPEGNWKILRFGMVRIGEPGCVDILNARSVEDYFHKMPETLLNDVGPFAGTTLTHFYNVSWEGVHPNWSEGFEELFFKNRKYKIANYLPILRGLVPNADPITAQRFVNDYLKSVADAFRENCYQTVGRLCHERGVFWHSEDGGPWNRKSPLFQEADMLAFWGQNDFPQGEFWISGNYNRTNIPYAAMAAHIYGRRDVSVEAFTHMNKHWTVYPALLKPYADHNYIFGANLFIWHTFTASPPELGRPGFEYFAGSHVNSNVTWWPSVGPFMKYMARCQLLLRQGKFVADLCVYTSDKNYVAWGNGKKWNPNSKLELPSGYRYDLLDTEVLVNRLQYKDGFFVLPDGMKYRVLVFDPLESGIPAVAILKIHQLVKAGAPVVLGALKPTMAVGLTDRQNSDQTVINTSAELWSNSKLNPGNSISEFLSDKKIQPDFEGPFEFHHRQIDGTDIYFVVGTGKGDCLFRMTGKKAELWNALDGSVTPVNTVATPDGRTKIALDLPNNGSIFVVFSEGATVNTASIPKKTVSSLTLSGPWTVSFNPELGGPKQVVFETLTPWNENKDLGIRYYSGSAVYSSEFELTAEQAEIAPILSLGIVCNIARVRFNGHDLGIVWTDPWTVALTGAKAGKNQIEIEVTNCWCNRLIGDAALEPAKRITRTNIVLEKAGEKMHGYRGYTADSPLLPSGLLGPVEIITQKP